MCSREICLIVLLLAPLGGCEAIEKSKDSDFSDGRMSDAAQTDASEDLSHVFVSSTVASGDSMAKATQLCQGLADRAELEGQFFAWTSISSLDAIGQLQGEGPWYRTDGVLAFPDRSSLAKTPLVPINRDENANTVDGALVYTGTQNNGIASDSDCSKWTSYYEEASATVGSVETTDDWSNSEIAHCGVPRRFYCFQSQ